MSKTMLGTAATIAKKQAELAAINNVALPRLYQQIGRRIAGLAKLPPVLTSHVERIRQLEASISAASPDVATASETGFAAKAKQLAQKAAKATSDAAASMQLNAAYAALGREAVTKFGEKAVPKELASELASLTAKQQELGDAIASLEATHSGGFLTPKRIVLAGTLCGVLLGGFVLFRGVGVIFGSGQPKAVSPAIPQLPDLGEITGRPARPKANTADALSAVTKELEDLSDTIRQESADASLQDVEGIERQWTQRVAEHAQPLARDSKIVSVRSGMTPEAREAFDAKAADQERLLAGVRKRSEESIASLLIAVRDQVRGGQSNGAESVQQFRATCEKEGKTLAETRSRAVDELCELANAAKASQQQLAAALEREYASACDAWAAKAAALGDITNDKAVTGLNAPKDVVNWKSRISNTQDQLTFKLNHLVEQQKAKAAEWAAAEAARFTVADNADTFRAKAAKTLVTYLDTALQEVKELRASKIAEVASHHAEAMQEQASKESSEAEEKARRGRSYEAPADLTDAELAEIIKEAPDITDLGLVRAVNLTDACIPAIASLKNLRSLYLSNRRFHVEENKNITAKGLSLLKGKQLRELTVPDRIFQTDEGFLAYLQAVADFRSCEVYWHEADVLRLDNARVSEQVLEELKDLPGILGLTLPGRISDRGLETLQHFPDLRRVDFFLTDKVTDAGIRSLAKCKNLRMITMWLPGGVTDIHITPEAIQSLNGMNLAWFVVPRAMHVDQFFEPVLNALSSEEVQARDGHPLDFMRRELELVDPREAFDPKIAANNPDTRQHVISSMWRWPCTPTVLKACAGKAGVEEVHIRECEVDEDALVSIGMLPDLKELFVFNTDITGRGLESLPNAKNLKRVEINRCSKFGRAGVAALAKCESLERLTLSEVPLLTDADLLLLTNCKSLERLIVSESGASSLLLVKLQNALPQCEIDIGP